MNPILDSGIIESYCLGTLPADKAIEVSALAEKYPEVMAAIDQTLAALEKYPQTLEPAEGLKSNVLGFLNAHWEESAIDLQNPPLIHLHSDAKAWNLALKDVTPDMEEPGMSARVLKETDDLLLSVVWLSDKLVEHKHGADEFRESFFILEGACECDFEGEIVRFSAGDYFDIPANTDHVIRNISEHLGFVKGLVQRRKAG